MRADYVLRLIERGIIGPVTVENHERIDDMAVPAVGDDPVCGVVISHREGMVCVSPLPCPVHGKDAK